MPRGAVVALVLLAAARAAWADPPPAAPTAPAAPKAAAVEFPLANGKALRGAVESADAAEVVLLLEGGERRRVPWNALAPVGVWRARAAGVRPDDGLGRRALAELAAELGLYALARAEFEKASALGALDPGALAAAVSEAEKRAVESGVARAERAADAGDVDGALAIARDLKIDFAAAADAKRVDALLESLLARIRTRETALAATQAEIEKVVAAAERAKRVAQLDFDARRLSDAADRAADEARASMPKAVVSRVRRSAGEAADLYDGSRRALGRLRRISSQAGPDREAVQARLSDLDRRQFRLLFEAAKFFWDERVYAAAEEFAARAAFVDPVDPALLELREEMRAHRIRYRLTDVSNARPTVR
jgi:hypothetical protein